MRILIPTNVAVPMGIVALARRYQIPVERTPAVTAGGPQWVTR